MPAAEIIQASEVAEELQAALNEVKAIQSRLMAIYIRIEASEDINLNRVNQANWYIEKAIGSIAAVPDTLANGIKIVKADR